MELIPSKYREIWVDPYRNLLNLQNEMNRLFSLSGYPVKEWESLEGFGKFAIDVQDKKNNLIVKADIPGMKKEDIEISVHDDSLVIKGEKKQEKEVKEKDFYKKERSFGSFYRAVSLPCRVNEKEIKASYKDGVLELTLPKNGGEKAKKIKVE